MEASFLGRSHPIHSLAGKVASTPETRIGLARATFVFGEDAARMFYDGAERFTRKGALPQITLRLLQVTRLSLSLPAGRRRARGPLRPALRPAMLASMSTTRSIEWWRAA